MDTTAAAVLVTSGVIISTILMFVKTFLEQFSWCKPTQSIHDPLVRVLAMGIGCVGFVLHLLALGTWTGPLVLDALAQGAVAGLSAIAVYHILPSAGPNPGSGAQPTSEIDLDTLVTKLEPVVAAAVAGYFNTVAGAPIPGVDKSVVPVPTPGPEVVSSI